MKSFDTGNSWHGCPDACCAQRGREECNTNASDSAYLAGSPAKQVGAWA
ncbi:hypothetical protein [Domibacillus aminovorans]|nr:hypothetical protein [Domibacillus aminovorans]